MATPDVTIESAALGSTATLDLSRRVATYQHPLYAIFLPIWRKLADIREGLGGFLDGSYLVAHPREWQDYASDKPSVPTKKLKARRQLACYENFASTIIDAKKSALFREQPTRRFGDESKQGTKPIETWWNNADGHGTHIDDFMQSAWDAAATFGHVYLYFDRPAGAAVQTAADAQTPYVALYTPIDTPDWLEDAHGQLTAVKFLERTPRDEFNQPWKTVDYRIRMVTTEYWAVYSSNGKLLEGGPVNGVHRLGVLPVVRLFAQRRALTASIGQSVLNDPQLYIDLYNLLSELRELLRNQTFSLLNIPLGTGADAMSIQDAQNMTGTQTGTENIVWSGHPAQFISADASNVKAYQDEIERRLRHIYRLTAISWESDSKDAEAKGSLLLKREDMNQRLAAYADELERVDYKMSEFYYRATLGADIGPRRLQQDQLVTRYPDTFDVTPFLTVLEQAQAALALQFPGMFVRELQKSLVAKFLPDLTPKKLEEITTAIDATPDPPTAADKLKAQTDRLAGGLKGVPGSNNPLSPINDLAASA